MMAGRLNDRDASLVRGLTSIGLVGPLPPPSGGMANQTRQLARLLEAEGVGVEVIQTNTPYRPAWLAGLRVVRALPRLFSYVACLWGAAGRVQVLHVMANSGWAWHLFAAPAIWVAWLRRVPVVVNYRGGDAERFFRRSFAWVKPSLGRASAVVVPSGFLREVFAKRGITVETIPNIVDASRFRPVSQSAREPTVWTVVVTRNLEPIYDIGTAIQAVHMLLRELPNVRLVIAGTGPERDSLGRLVGSLDMENVVEFAGRLENEDIHQLYQRAHVMLNPSLVDNMPISVLEALASGVPVVSTRVGGVPHLVEDGETALLVRPGDCEAMAKAALACLRDAHLRARLIRQGLELASRHTWPSVRPLWLGTYRRVLAGFGATRVSEVGGS